MKIGIFFSYWEKNWEGDFFKYVQKAHDLGLEALEVSAGELLNMSDDELKALKALAEQLGIVISCNIGPAKKYDIASRDENVREAGLSFEKAIIDKMTILGSDTLIGAVYSFWPYDFEDLDKEAMWDRSVKSMKILGDYAQERGISICLEVLNRFENILLNTAEEAVKFIEDIGSPAVKILLDTFHMNIEEDYIPDAIRTAGKYLGHFHVGESNRRLPRAHKGSLDWENIGSALKEIGYDKLVIAEPFVTVGGQIAKDIKVWRDLSNNATEADLDRDAEEYGRFMRTSFGLT